MKHLNRIHSCPVCDSENIYSFFEIDDFGYFNVPVNPADKEKLLDRFSMNDLKAPIDSALCHDCSHIFLQTLPDPAILQELYENHYNYASPIEGTIQPTREDYFIGVFEDFVGRHPEFVAGMDLLEIACNDGYIISKLAGKGFKPIGIDPGKAADIARRHGLNVIKQNYDPALFESRSQKFNVIISRYLLEHIQDCKVFLRSISRNICNGGLLVFEVPNMSFYIDTGLTETFTLQHYHYFNGNSLGRLFSESGFLPLNMINNKESTIIFAQHFPDNTFGIQDVNIEKFVSYRHHFEAHRLETQKALASLIDLDKKIAFWGAGGFAYMLFLVYAVPSRMIEYIVDSDVRKHGMGYIDHDIKIVPPGKILEDSIECVVISSMFSDSIVRQLGEMQYKGTVLVLYPHPQLITM